MRQASGKDDVILVSRGGQAIRFQEKLVRPMGRPAAGVIGMRLGPRDEVLAMALADQGEDLVTITEAGFGKRTPVKEYPRKGRGGKGVVTHKFKTKSDRLAGAFVGSKDQDVFVISTTGIVIRIPAEQIRRTGRPSMGVRVMKFDSGVKVAAVAPVIAQAEQPELPNLTVLPGGKP